MRFACGIAVVALAGLAQERGRLLAVRAGGDAGASSIEVVGDRPLSFTTLKLQSPPRVVVDFPDAEVMPEARDLAVDDGTIRRVVAAAAGQRTARVVIELAGEAEFEVRAVENRVEVRVPRIAPLLAQPEPPPAPAALAANTPATSAATDSDASRTAPKSPQAAAQPAGAAATTAAAGRSAALARNDSVATTAPAAQQAAAAENEPAAPADRPAAGPGEPASPAASGGSVPLVPPVASQDIGAAVAAKPASGAADEPREREAEKRASLPTVALVGSGAPPQRPPPAAGPAKARPKAAAAENARLAAKAKEAAERKARAAGHPPRQVAMAGRHITGIGFRPVGAGEVIVRSDHPLEYGVSGEGDTVLVHLPGAGIPLPNNRRPLDTRFFGGPVQRIVPVAGPAGTDLRIEMRGHAEYQLAQSGTVLTVTFSAPH